MDLVIPSANCFMCLKHNTNSSSLDLVSPKLPTFEDEIKLEAGSLELQLELQPISLSVICQYLKINDEIKKDCKMKGVKGEAPLPVLLCQNCVQVTAKLTELCNQLQLVQMKMNHTMEQFYKRITGANGGVEEDNQLETNFHFKDEPLRLLRAKIIENCDIQLKKVPRPIVKLNRIKEDNKDVNLLPLSTFKMILSMKSEPLEEEAGGNEWSGSNTDPLDEQDSILPPSPVGRHPPSSLTITFNCKICGRRFSTIDARRKHVRTHSPPQLDKLTCSVCPTRPTLSGHLAWRRHNNRYHLDQTFSSSRLSHISTSQFQEYCKHVMHIEGLVSKCQWKGTESFFRCQHCQSKSVSTWSLLREHLIAYHPNIISNKLLALQQSTRVEELRLVPLPILRNDRKCEDCGITFSHSSSLNKHRKEKCVFRKDKSICSTKRCKCPHCGEVFAQTSTYYKHRRTAHAGEKGKALILI